MTLPAPLRIASVTHQALPSNDAASVQLVHTAAALVRAGAWIDLFLPTRFLGPRRVPELRAALEARYDVACEFGLRPLATDLRPLRRTAAMVHALAASIAAARRYDLVHTRDLPTVVFGLAAGQQVLFESYRVPAGQPRLSRLVLDRVLPRRHFLGQITHSVYARERCLEAGYPPEKIHTVYNGFDARSSNGSRTPPEARRFLGLPEQLTVGYAGRIGPTKRIDLLLDAAARTPELQWVLAGDTETKEARPYRVAGEALPNVRFLGYLHGASLAPALEAADLLVIPPSADPLHRFRNTVLPLKVFQYLAAGRAMVVGDLPDTAELLSHDVNCVRVPPDDVSILVAAVRDLAADPARRERLGRAASTLAQGLTWDARAARILEYLHQRLAAIEERPRR